jgi:phosphate:Na+ symporter
MPTGPAAALLLRRLLPERAPDAGEGAPRYLDEAALGTPSVALANTSRPRL